MTTARTCRALHEEKPLTEFYAHQNTKDKRQQHCRAFARKVLTVLKHERQIEGAIVKLHAQAKRLREVQEWAI